MADAHGSGPCVRKDVGVQLPPCAREKGSGFAGPLSRLLHAFGALPERAPPSSDSPYLFAESANRGALVISWEPSPQAPTRRFCPRTPETLIGLSSLSGATCAPPLLDSLRWL